MDADYSIVKSGCDCASVCLGTWVLSKGHEGRYLRASSSQSVPGTARISSCQRRVPASSSAQLCHEPQRTWRRHISTMTSYLTCVISRTTCMTSSRTWRRHLSPRRKPRLAMFHRVWVAGGRSRRRGRRHTQYENSLSSFFTSHSLIMRTN